MHWAKNCPHKTNIKSVNVAETISDDDDNYDEEVNITLMTSQYEILVNEMEALNKVKIVPSEKTFKFGDGRKVFSTFQAIIPARIGSTDCFIQTEIVDEKIPLLLSKSAI